MEATDSAVPSARSSVAPAFPLLVLCFFLSGATGLVYQVVWLRMLGLVFGHTVYATTTVLVAFMAGLGLGSWLLARRAARLRNLVAIYGWLEVGIGLYCALLPLLFAGAAADGRNYLLTTRALRRHRVRTLQSVDRRTGVLLHRRAFRHVRARLKPGGLFVQWLQGYSLEADDFRMIMRTFQSVFPDAQVWNTVTGDTSWLACSSISRWTCVDSSIEWRISCSATELPRRSADLHRRRARS